MKDLLSVRAWTAFAAVAVAAAVAAGVSYAATSGITGHAASSSRLYACVLGGVERNELSLSSASATCPRGEQKVSWNISGQRGPLGRRGPKGNTGAPGPKGAIGAAGPKGDTGAPGPKGDTGATGSLASAYLDAYNSTFRAVPINGDLTFDTQTVAPVGITTNAADTAFTVTDAGNYLITVVPLTSAPGGGSTVKLTLNGTVGQFVFGTYVRMLNLAAGDVLTVRDVGPNPGFEDTSAGITIVRIS